MNTEHSTTSTMTTRKVLTEEEYVSTLGSIVQRDYFPSLPSLRRDVAVLQARTEGDIGKAVAIRRAARLLEQHAEVTQSSDATAKLSLNDFHANATSEDNAEFDEVQRKELKEKRELFSLMYDAKMAIADASDVKARNTPLHLQMASDQYDMNQNENIRLLKHAREERPRNALFFTPQLPPSCSNGADLGTVPKLLNMNEHCEETGNDAEMLIQHENILESSKLIQSDKSRDTMPPPKPVDMDERLRQRLIQPENTRFPGQSSSRLVVRTTSIQKPSFSLSFFSSDTDTDLDLSPRPIDEVRKRSRQKKEEEHQTFVAMTPLIQPGDENDTGVGSPIITWGNIAATPLVISEVLSRNNYDEDEQLNIPSFRIKHEGERDRLARVAEEEAAKRSRTINDNNPSRTKVDSSASCRKKPSLLSKSLSLQDRSKSLTPAARSLLSKSLKKKEASYLKGILGSSSSRASSSRLGNSMVHSRLPSALGSALKNSMKRSKMRSLATIDAPSAVSTPRISISHTKTLRHQSDYLKLKSPPEMNSNLTDDLLI